MLDRRQFLGVGALALGAAAPRPVAAATGTVTLGATGLEVSDIGFGSSRSADPKLVRHALDRGVTYFDTAESYRFGAAESAIGEGLAGIRDQVVVASKTKAGARDSQADMMAALEGSLRRLRTDYLDIYFLHSVNSVARLQNPEWLAFTERAKEQGKIRFRGVSGHGSALTERLDYALDNDLADVLLASYTFAQDPDFAAQVRHALHYVSIQPELPRVLEKAKAKGVGVIAMKTLMGARLNDMRPFERAGGTYSQAAFRWVLSSPRVDSLIVSMTSRALIDEYMAASGDQALLPGDIGLLARYSALQEERYCRPGCGA
ncbi:MAG: aldo/keto reductase, partial [Alphaproteobacteria bacterium]|nr:aldo/keto reductase [Alphaproteobacteria bacterium]